MNSTEQYTFKILYRTINNNIVCYNLSWRSTMSVYQRGVIFFTTSGIEKQDRTKLLCYDFIIITMNNDLSFIKFTADQYYNNYYKFLKTTSICFDLYSNPNFQFTQNPHYIQVSTEAIWAYGMQIWECAKSS